MPLDAEYCGQAEFHRYGNANGRMFCLIASLLVVLYSGRKLNRRMYEMIRFYLPGWVSDEELDAALG